MKKDIYVSINIEIVWQDKHLLVANKPSGVVVNRSPTVCGETIQDWAEEKLKVENGELKVDKEGDFYRRAGIVHRLDKETSGLLIIAKSEKAFINLQTQFKKRIVKKKYKALAHGKIASQKGKIKVPVARLPWRREKFGILPGGKNALTSYRLISYLTYKGSTYSYLELSPKTGRTHQIRVHLKYLGNPIVSDKLYAGRKRYKRDKTWCPRLFLHAFLISFKHPVVLRKTVSVECDLPKDLKLVIDKMKK